MEKNSFKVKRFNKQNEFCQEKLDILEEKYQKIKEILKQVLKDFKTEKALREALQIKCAKLSAEVNEKDELLERMHSVSEAVVDEFSALKVKCEMETEAANNAIKRATKYFQENQKLKENIFEDASLSIENASNVVDNDESESELDILSTHNSELRSEVGSLKTKLSKEIEKQTLLNEDLEIAKHLYEQEMREHRYTEEKLKSLEMLYDSVVQAIDSLITTEDSVPDSMCIDQAMTSNEMILTSSHVNSVTRDVINSLAIIEKQKNCLQNRVKELEQQVLNIKLKGSVDNPISPPPPPPPPPPPSFNPLKSFMTFINAGKKPPRKISVVSQEGVDSGHQKAMTEMINAIKKGNIHLKPVPKVTSKLEENTSEPVALVEMKSILQTLKKRKKGDLFNSQVETTLSSNLKENNVFNEVIVSDSAQETSLSPTSEISEGLLKNLENSSNGDYTFTDVLTTPLISPSSCETDENKFKYPEISCCDNVSEEDECVLVI